MALDYRLARCRSRTCLDLHDAAATTDEAIGCESKNGTRGDYNPALGLAPAAGAFGASCHSGTGFALSAQALA